MFARLGVFGLVGILFLPMRTKFRRLRTFVLGLLAIAFIMTLGSCGGSSTTAGTTPIGTYTFTVNATGTAGTNGGNTSVHQISLTLIVTAVTSTT